MLKGETLTNYEPQSSIAKTRDPSVPSPPIFILCDTCYWCATYFDKTRIPVDNDCPQCNANSNELTSFPIMANESFIFDYNDKLGVELGFKPRRKDNNS
jgi:hypothetical protein